MDETIDRCILFSSQVTGIGSDGERITRYGYVNMIRPTEPTRPLKARVQHRRTRFHGLRIESSAQVRAMARSLER